MVPSIRNPCDRTRTLAIDYHAGSQERQGPLSRRLQHDTVYDSCAVAIERIPTDVPSDSLLRITAARRMRWSRRNHARDEDFHFPRESVPRVAGPLDHAILSGLGFHHEWKPMTLPALRPLCQVVCFDRTGQADSSPTLSARRLTSVISGHLSSGRLRFDPVLAKLLRCLKARSASSPASVAPG